MFAADLQSPESTGLYGIVIKLYTNECGTCWETIRGIFMPLL